jgi:hypothetical protein
VVEFLGPLPAGLSKDDFMASLEAAVESRSDALIAAARTGRDA